MEISELVDECRKGKQNAQLELYRRYYKAMYNISYRIVYDAMESEDIMQEAFLTAFTRLDELQESEAFGGWLKRIVVNKSLSAYRKRGNNLEVPLENVEYGLSAEDATVEINSSTLDKSSIMQAMQKLKDSYRVILSLHLIEGYDHEEICEILSITYANCRTMLSRAKNNLRKELQVFLN